MSHTVGGVATDYTWDIGSGLPVVLQETNREVLFRPSQNAVYRERSEFTYVYGLDLISVTDGEGAQRYSFTDSLGSVTSTIADDGTTASGYSYEAFGTPSTLSPSDRFLFTGEQYDAKARKAQAPAQSAETGLYYLRARYYDSSTGRFLGRDPLGVGHPYAYVGNNPVNLVDPSGLVLINESAGCCGGPIGFRPVDVDLRPLFGAAAAATATAVSTSTGVASDIGTGVADAGTAVGNSVVGAGDSVVDGIGGLFGSSKKQKPLPPPYVNYPTERNYELEDWLQTLYSLPPPGQGPKWIQDPCHILFPHNLSYQVACWTLAGAGVIDAFNQIVGPFLVPLGDADEGDGKE